MTGEGSRAAREIRIGASSKELAMAERLIDEMTGKWDPAGFKDTYSKDLLARIKEKIKSKETHYADASLEGEGAAQERRGDRPDGSAEEESRPGQERATRAPRVATRKPASQARANRDAQAQIRVGRTRSSR